VTHTGAAAGPTRERLLDAAERLFAERGFKRASVREITAAAGCNLAAVNYHFGSKRALYRAVFSRRLGALREQRLAALRRVAGGSDAASTELLRAFAEAFLAPLDEEGGGQLGLRLIAQEMTDPQLPAGFFRNELVVPVNRALQQTVAAAAPELPERTVQLCVQSFLAQLLHIIHARQFAALKGTALPHPFTVAELVDHIVRFTTAGIERLREAARRRGQGGEA